ncbi:hypothetical protein LSAT2_027802 [Lamellibrachia satsuma]|nr:hypothetical protein LSAT2_027802 [Lamellibrachia satsuma]
MLDRKSKTPALLTFDTPALTPAVRRLWRRTTRNRRPWLRLIFPTNTFQSAVNQWNVMEGLLRQANKVPSLTSYLSKILPKPTLLIFHPLHIISCTMH